MPAPMLSVPTFRMPFGPILAAPSFQPVETKADDMCWLKRELMTFFLKGQPTDSRPTLIRSVAISSQVQVEVLPNPRLHLNVVYFG